MLGRVARRLSHYRALVVAGALVGLVLGIVLGARAYGIPLAPGSHVACATLEVSHDRVAKVKGPLGSATGSDASGRGEGYVSSREVARDVSRNATRRGIRTHATGTIRCIVVESQVRGRIEVACVAMSASEARDRVLATTDGIDAMAHGLSANGDSFSARIVSAPREGRDAEAISLVGGRLVMWGVMGTVVLGLLATSAALLLARRDDARVAAPGPDALASSESGEAA